MIMNSENKVILLAPVSGELMPINQVRDHYFSEKRAGDGIGIEPASGPVVAPVTGKVIKISDAKESITFQTDGGLEVTVHLGLDTADLNGAPFTVGVRIGDRVEAGDEVAFWDIGQIIEAGKQPTVVITIPNSSTVLDGLIITGINAIVGYPAVELKIK